MWGLPSHHSWGKKSVCILGKEQDPGGKEGTLVQWQFQLLWALCLAFYQSRLLFCFLSFSILTLGITSPTYFSGMSEGWSKKVCAQPLHQCLAPIKHSLISGIHISNFELSFFSYKRIWTKQWSVIATIPHCIQKIAYWVNWKGGYPGWTWFN